MTSVQAFYTSCAAAPMETCLRVSRSDTGHSEINTLAPFALPQSAGLVTQIPHWTFLYL